MRTPRRSRFSRSSSDVLLVALCIVAAALLVPVQASAGTAIVTSAGDGADANPGDAVCADAAGACTLRAAIEETNALALGTPHTIRFAIGAGLVTISPATELPALTRQNTVIDGTTQPGYAGTPIVELDGSGAGALSDGLTLSGGDHAIKGLVINRFGYDGVLITSNDNLVDLCYIGVDPTGAIDRGNGAVGVAIAGGSTGNHIGAASPGVRNVISGNGSSGVAISGASVGNTLRGNFIGVNVTGTAAIANDFYGVVISEASTNNVVGETSTLLGNLISGNNSAAGVMITGAGSDGNVVQHNIIGTNLTMTAAIPNNTGVAIDSGASGNWIGGTNAADANVISGNTYSGVSIHASNGNTVASNIIGADLPGVIDLGNGQSGVQLVDATGNTVGLPTHPNLIVGNTGNGVTLQGGGSHTVAGNLIGINIAGVTIANDHYGVYLTGTSSNIIGGTVANSGNLISGNGWEGVMVDGDGWLNVIQGNRIGTNASGSVAVPNRGGIIVNGPDPAGSQLQEYRVRIGGTEDGAMNLISGNTNAGVMLTGSAAYCQVWHNMIGLSAGSAALGNGHYGVELTNGASYNHIGDAGLEYRNVIGANGWSGVSLNGSTTRYNVILGNLIGTNTSGNEARANGEHGLLIREAQYNTVGGPATGAANVFSGNTQNGIRVAAGATGNAIKTNWIGTFAGTYSPLANGSSGIRIEDSASNEIGGAGPGEGNTVGFNGGNGIELIGGTTRFNTVYANRIGTDSAGTVDAGNVGHGILLSSAPDNFIGSQLTDAGNVIGFNGGDGVAITGPPPCILKTLSRNSIASNDGLGIDLGDDGVTPNDPGDPDTGPNNLQNFPNITEATILGGSTRISGSLNTSAGTYRLEFFSSPACDPSGYGEGAVYLGTTNVLVSETVANFTVELPVTVTEGHVVTATATDGGGNTSEFSACMAAGQEFAEAVPALDAAGLMTLLALLALAGALALRSRTGTV